MHTIPAQQHALPIRALLNRWVALCLLLALLGQAVLPTLAYTRSQSEPGLWNEICSVYGVRVSDTKVPGTPSHNHADCPLCLHVFNDTILVTPGIAHNFHLLFFNVILHVVDPVSFINFFAVVPAARGPPSFN